MSEIQSPSSTSFQIGSAPLPPAGFTMDQDRTSEITPASTDQNKTINALHVINGEHFAGAERVQQLLGKCFHEFGVRSEFACLKQGKFPEISGLPESQVHSLEMKGRLDFGAANRLLEIARDGNFDLLHAHTPRSAMLTAMVAYRLNLPWLYHVHSPAARDSTRWMINQVNHWLEKVCHRNCSQLITVSRSLRRELLEQGIPRSKVVAIGNGVAELPTIDVANRADQNSWRLGMIALFRPRKGIEVLLQALSQLSDLDRKIDLDVIGGFETEAYENEIRNLVRQLKLDDVVRFTGFTSDVPSALSRLDAMVLPSLFGEGMPMVVLEALSCGVPVVATSVEGTPEVVRHGVEGLLAEPGDPISLANCIRVFTSDRNRWTQMSQNAVTRHRTKFSDKRMAERVARVYRNLLAP